MARITILILTLLLATSNQTQAEMQSIRIIDGDTLQLNGEIFRLYGIDAPELKQTCKDSKGKDWSCGKASKAFLEGLIVGREVECIAKLKDKYQREIAVCNAGVIDIGQEIVQAGYAIAYIQYSMEYMSSQEYAKKNSLGIWEGTFILPSDYRKRKSH